MLGVVLKIVLATTDLQEGNEEHNDDSEENEAVAVGPLWESLGRKRYNCGKNASSLTDGVCKPDGYQLGKRPTKFTEVSFHVEDMDVLEIKDKDNMIEIDMKVYMTIFQYLN